jgi:hypothetical protein
MRRRSSPGSRQEGASAEQPIGWGAARQSGGGGT